LAAPAQAPTTHAARETSGAPNSAPTAKSQTHAGKSSGAAQTVVADQSRSGRTKKIIAPILAGIGELRHPVALLKSASSHVWPVSRLQWGRSVADELLSDATNNPMLLDIRIGAARYLQVSSPSNDFTAAPFDGSDSESLATLAHGRPAPLVRNSAAQLNLRVSRSLSFLAEVDRRDAVVGDSELGVGLGFKVAF
jgi:hypothetical protein